MDVSREHLEIVEGARGSKARILGHRVNAEHVVGWYEVQGWSVAKIVEEIPTITPADVHAVLAYYWDHKDELDRKWADDEARIAALMEEHIRNNPSKFQIAKKQLEEKWRLEAEARQAAEKQPEFEKRQHVG